MGARHRLSCKYDFDNRSHGFSILTPSAVAEDEFSRQEPGATRGGRFVSPFLVLLMQCLMY